MVSVSEGDVVAGKVTKLQDFGAFVDLGDGVSGLVHISEVSDEFVENIHAYLTEDQEVEVMVVGVKEDGRVDLSIKRADPEWSEEARPRPTAKVDKEFNQRLRKFMHKSDMIQGEVRKRKKTF